MLTAREFLNKIKWDPREDPKDYSLLYYDRVSDKLEELELSEIEVEDNLLTFEDITGTKINIPLHRIRIIKKKGQAVWQR